MLAELGSSASELEDIQVALAEEADAIQLGLRKPLLIGVTLAILQQVTGTNTILYCGSVIFTEHAGKETASAALWANVTIGLINLVCTVFALFTIDKLGRKLLLMVASAGMGISLSVLSCLFSGTISHRTAILSFVLCYVACFAVGIGPGVWVVISELFPTKVRGKATSVATINLGSACSLITSTFLSLVFYITIQGAFGIYTVLCLCTFFFVWWVVPETKGQTLESIERQWMV